jgi:hypothetical protein
VSDRKELYAAYLETDTWKKIRGIAVRRDDNRCRVCNSARYIQVHHRKYPSVLGTESTEDLITLCGKCHELFHKGNGKAKSPKKVKHKTRSKPLNEVLVKAKAKLSKEVGHSGGTLNNVTKKVCRQLGRKYPGKGHRGPEDCMVILREYVGSSGTPLLPKPIESSVRFKLRKKIDSLKDLTA